MITKMVDLSSKDLDTKSWEKKWGNYNDPPPNFQEISEEEFAGSMFFIYSPEYVEFRQIDPARMPKKLKKEPYYMDIRLYYFHGGRGFGMTQQDQKRVRYFKFYLCDHEFRELSQPECRAIGVLHFGRCYHVTQCTKCHYVESYDSSD